jgi:hypothetical protein
MKHKIFIFAAVSLFIGTIATSLLAPIEALYLERLTSNSFLIGLALGIGSIGALLSPLIGKSF